MGSARQRVRANIDASVLLPSLGSLWSMSGGFGRVGALSVALGWFGRYRGSGLEPYVYSHA